jgi:hypothetical protein
MPHAIHVTGFTAPNGAPQQLMFSTLKKAGNCPAVPRRGHEAGIPHDTS